MLTLLYVPGEPTIDGSLVKFPVLNIALTQLVSKVIKKSGFESRAVEDGLQALEAIVYEKFDLVLMDVRMPIMNGIEATRWIRDIEQSADGTKRIPILGYSAHSDPRECMDAGMDGFMTKPALLSEMKEQLQRWLE